MSPRRSSRQLPARADFQLWISPPKRRRVGARARLEFNRWLHALARRWRALRLRLGGAGPRERAVGHGLRMTIHREDEMDRAFYQRTYDPKLILLLETWLKPGDVALDCGAQKGYVSLHLGRAVGPEGCVLAFEPDERARRWLEEHTLRNRLPQVQVHPLALGERTGRLRFHLSSQLGWSTAYPNELAAPTVAETVEVPVEALDELRRTGRLAWPEGKLRWIKIDCEGSEVKVLRGMRDLLRREEPLLWVEVNADALRAAAADARELFNLLQAAGYRLHRPVLHYTWWGAPRLWLVHCPAPLPDPLYDVVAIKTPTWMSRRREIAPVVNAT